MPNNVQFPPSLIIDVSILPTPQDIGSPNINTVALFTQDAPSWVGVDTYRIYRNATDVGTDFGTSSNAYKIAVAFFAQQPNVLTTGGYLTIIPRLTGPLESVQAAIARMKDIVYFFGILVDEEYHAAQSTLTALAAYVEGLDKMLFYCSSYTADFGSGGLLDLIRTAGDVQTRCLYYHDGVAIDTPAFAAAYASRLLSADFSGSGTAGTMNLKQIIAFTADQTLTQTLLTQAQAAGVDVYINMGGLVGLYTSGKNNWSDQIYGQFWLKFAIQTAGTNYLAGTSYKIPQTEIGMEGLKNAYRRVGAQGVVNGFMAPGSWTSPDTFGDPAALIRNILGIGYYVYSQPITQQSQSDRTARKAPLCQIAVKLAGAIHSSSVIVNVNQ